MTCLWCGRPFRARRRGGSLQKFCCAAHRTAFHSAARRWAEHAVAAGALRVADLKAVPQVHAASAKIGANRHLISVESGR